MCCATVTQTSACLGIVPAHLDALQVLVALATASSGATNAAALRSAVPRETVVGLLRDVRGIASATNSRRTYGMLLRLLTALCGARSRASLLITIDVLDDAASSECTDNLCASWYGICRLFLTRSCICS